MIEELENQKPIEIVKEVFVKESVPDIQKAIPEPKGQPIESMYNFDRYETNPMSDIKQFLLIGKKKVKEETKKLPVPAAVDTKKGGKSKKK